MTATTHPLSELRAALRGLDAGTYTHPPTGGVLAGLDRLTSTAVGVVGVSGGVGATVVGLAIAEVLGADRLIELCPPSLSGLVEATTAELGQDQGWRLGTRGNLHIERRETDTAAIRRIPGQMVVIDCGAWSGSTAEFGADVAALVMVAPCTIPGVRRLSNLLSLSPAGTNIFAVLTGTTHGKALPRAMTSAAGPQVEAMIRDGHLVTVPACAALRRAGITGDPLPKAVLAAATLLAHQLKDVLP